jgi:hypothetical protein
MHKYWIFIIIFYFPYIAHGAGYTDMVDQKYTGIFHNVTPGRLNFRVAGINKHSFSLEQREIIEEFNSESIQSHNGAYAVHIRNILYYNDKQIFFIVYSYKDTYDIFWKGIDIVIKEGLGLRYDFTLKEFRDRDCNLSFTKIINTTLFFTFSDTLEIYAMELDSGRYEIKQYNHNIGQIQNIWLKTQGDSEYIFTSKKDGKIISGIFKINEQNIIELVEVYTYQVFGYEITSATYIYINQDNILSYRTGNNSSACEIKEFIGEGEKIYNIFFLEDNSFIVASTATGSDRFANIFFGSGNLMYYFYYYHVKKHSQSGNFIIKKIESFGNLWKLEQLIL